MRGLVGLMLLAALPCAAQDDVAEEDGDMMTVTTAPVQEDIQLDCVFDRECLEDEGCTDGGFKPFLDAHAGGLDPEVLMVEANLVADAGTVFMMGARDRGRLSLSGGDFEARHLLTVAGDGAARYTVHYAEGPMMVSYLGRCEAAQ